MEPTPKEMAAQLRKPNGELGLKVGEMMNKSNQHTNKFIFDQLKAVKGDQVLEIGFGNGFFISHILGQYPGTFYFGIDFSVDMVREASYRNMRYINSGIIELQEASVESIPYPENYFDGIFTINTLYFWPEPLSNAKEVLRVLRPGQQFILGIRPKSTVKDFPFIEHGFTLYEPEEAEALLKEAGFKNVHHMIQKDPAIEWNGQEMVLESACIVGTK